MATQPQALAVARISRHEISKSKNRVLIQGIKENVLELYNLLKTRGSLKDTTFYVAKTKKVRIGALVTNLENFAKLCESVKLKNDITNAINDVKELLPGGSSRVFISHDGESSGKTLEFVCVVVYKYISDFGEVCDYLLTTYSYKQHIQYSKVAFAATGAFCGAGAVLTGAGILAGIATDGLFFIVMAGASTIVGGIINHAGQSAKKTELPAKLRDYLEAAFLHELVGRSYVLMVNNQIYMNLEE